MAACRNGRIEIIKLLLAANADVHAVNIVSGTRRMYKETCMICMWLYLSMVLC